MTEVILEQINEESLKELDQKIKMIPLTFDLMLRIMMIFAKDF